MQGVSLDFEFGCLLTLKLIDIFRRNLKYTDFSVCEMESYDAMWWKNPTSASEQFGIGLSKFRIIVEVTYSITDRMTVYTFLTVQHFLYVIAFYTKKVNAVVNFV